jgi:fermentation-respiration switch protein FrsA (DUF1100 family)
MAEKVSMRVRLRRIMTRAAVMVACVHIGLAGLLFFAQSSFVYCPSKQMDATPKSSGLDYEDVTFAASDGVRLNGWFIPAEKSPCVVLFCHGNAGNLSSWLSAAEMVHDMGLSIFMFDYRGYGLSGGKPTEGGTYLDAEAAWAHLVETRKVPPEQVVIVGRSLGGPIAAKLAGRTNPKALVLESTFTSMPDVAGDVFPYMPTRIICRFKYPTLEYLKGVKCPVMIVHSREDELIPFKHGQRLFEGAAGPKRFLEIKGTHNEGYFTSGRTYVDGFNGFARRPCAN